MKVDMIRYTQDADMLCGEAAALCTGFAGDPLKALKGALASGHESVAEHATFTFRIEGVSRILLAQLTRHRIASFSVQSQRYCGCDAEDVVIPDSFRKKRFVGSVNVLLRKASEVYDALVMEGVPEEDARFIVPQGVKCKLMMTMNARELRHFFSMRCCNRAQWEIRQLAQMMLQMCKSVAPVLFADAGAGCVRGACPEGAKSCKKGTK